MDQRDRDERFTARRRELRTRLVEALRRAGYADRAAITRALDKQGQKGVVPERTLRRYLDEGPPIQPKSTSITVVTVLGELAGIRAEFLDACEGMWREAQRHRHVETLRQDDPQLLPPQWYGIIPEQPGRPYASVDLVTIEKQNGDLVEGTMRRVSPPIEGGYSWRFSGTCYGLENVFLNFRPVGDSHPISRGTVSLQKVGYRNYEYTGHYSRARGEKPDASELILRRYEWRRLVPQSAMHKVALIDVDRTLYEDWTLRPWLAFLSRRGVPRAQESLDSVARLMEAFDGAVDPHDELVRACGAAYAESMSQQSVQSIDDAAKTFVRTTHASRLFTFVKPMLKLLLTKDIAPVLVTGAPEPVVRACADKLGVEQFHAMRVETWAGGAVYGDTVARDAGLAGVKASVAEELIRAGKEVVLAVGDSSSDVPLWDSAETKLIVGTRTPEKDWDPRRTRNVDPAKAPDELIAWLDDQLDDSEVPRLVTVETD